jgi:hypothetical protein
LLDFSSLAILHLEAYVLRMGIVSILVLLENGEEGVGGGEISIDGIVVLLSYLISFALYAGIGLALVWMILTLWGKVFNRKAK